MISLGPAKLERQETRRDGYPNDPASIEVFNRGPNCYQWVLQSRLVATPIAVLAIPAVLFTLHIFNTRGISVGGGLLMLALIVAIFLAPLTSRSVWLRMHLKRLRSRGFNCCPSCLYSLEQLRTGDPCPECGFDLDGLDVRRAWRDLFNTVLRTKYPLDDD